MNPKQTDVLLPGRRPATAKDVAESAGVARPTVSAVLNGARSGTMVSAATRARILAAAEELRYRPNMAARTMKSGKSRQVRVLVRNNSRVAMHELRAHPLACEFILGISEGLYPYFDEGTTIVPLATGMQPLAQAQQLLKSQLVSEAKWHEAYARLNAKATAAGLQKPAVTTGPQAAYDPSGGLQLPLPWKVPNTIEFENYDVGGPSVSFHDTNGENYRKDAVDVKASPKAGNDSVMGYTQNGEWMEYTVNVAKAGNYRLSVAYATPESGRRIRLSLNDKALGEAITFTPTASWDDLKTVNAGTV